MIRLTSRPGPAVGSASSGRYFSAPDILGRVRDACTALSARAHVRYSFLDAGTDTAEREHLEKLASQLRSRADDLVVLGIGGSSLGTLAVMHGAVAPRRDRVHVLESPDPVALKHKLEGLDPGRTAVNVISKSGGTIETASQWAIIEAWLARAGDYRGRVILTTDPAAGPLRELATRGGYTSLPVPQNVGGRFSVFTPVGLLPLAFAGVDLAGLGAGIRAAASEGLGETGLAATLAKTLVQANLDEARPLVVVWPYGDALWHIGRWFQQLWGESLGKARHSDGSVAHTGSTPLACLGPNDQHSLLQLFAEGPKDKHFLFLSAETLPERLMIEKSSIPGTEYLAGLELGTILRAEARATAGALASLGRPVSFVSLPDLSSRTIAELLVQLMSATVIAGSLYEVDPFDQPGVELGKRIALGLLGNERHVAEAKALERFLP